MTRNRDDWGRGDSNEIHEYLYRGYIGEVACEKRKADGAERDANVETVRDERAADDSGRKKKKSEFSAEIRKAIYYAAIMYNSNEQLSNCTIVISYQHGLLLTTVILLLIIDVFVLVNPPLRLNYQLIIIVPLATRYEWKDIFSEK